MWIQNELLEIIKLQHVLYERSLQLYDELQKPKSPPPSVISFRDLTPCTIYSAQKASIPIASGPEFLSSQRTLIGSKLLDRTLFARLNVNQNMTTPKIEKPTSLENLKRLSFNIFNSFSSKGQINTKNQDF